MISGFQDNISGTTKPENNGSTPTTPGTTNKGCTEGCIC